VPSRRLRPSARALIAAAGGIALVVRVLHVWQISHVPWLSVRVGDAEAYHAWALTIAGGDWLGTDVFYQSPLYPYLLAIVYAALNDSVTTIRLMQAALGATSCALLASAGVSLFGRAGALAGLGLALYPAAIFLDGQLDKSALATLLFTTLVAVLVSRVSWTAGAAEAERRRTTWSIGVGVMLGLLTLTRENALLLALPIVVWLSSGHGSRRERLRRASACLVGLIIVLLPVGIRNLTVGGEFHLTTAQLGPNLYIGNHAGASGTYEPLVEGHGSARDERDDATRLAEQAVGRQLSPREVSGYWTTQAVTYMRAHPADWVRLTAHKARLAFNAHEISDTESQDVYADSSIVLRALAPLSFGVLLVLAAAGAVLTAHRWKDLWLLYAMGTTYVAGLIAFYVVARYRFPLVPPLLLFAAGGVAEVMNGWRALRGTRLVGVVAAATAAVLFAFVPSEHVRAARSTHFTAVASTLSRSGENDEAIALYQRALTELPAAPAAEFGLATALVRSGRSDDALPHFATTVRAWPEHAEARYNFGLTLLKVGHLDEAIGQLLESARLRPDDLDARMAAGRALMAASRPDEAVAHYRAVLTRFPRHVAALAALGVALSASGHLDDALGVYRTAFEIDPTNPDVQNNWGWSLASSGQVEDAIPHFERALALNPAHANARENLKRAQAALR
jgi:Flp pilus assembly protein TadD/4-amino-4-deoxy-L-arabinose transferase-like glycosyltransferase